MPAPADSSLPLGGGESDFNILALAKCEKSQERGLAIRSPHSIIRIWFRTTG